MRCWVFTLTKASVIRSSTSRVYHLFYVFYPCLTLLVHYHIFCITCWIWKGPFWSFLAVKVNGSDVKPGICLVTPRCFNIQTSHGFKNFCLFSSSSTYSVRNQVIYFQYVYNCVYSL